MQNEKNGIERVLDCAVKNISQIIDANKIIGAPIVNEKGQTVIPVLKTTVCTFCGGGEYGDVKVIKECGEYFAGGAVSVLNVKPECFVIDNGNGFSVINESGEGLEAFLKSVAKILSNIKL